MSETISNFINNHISVMLFYLPFIILPVVALVLFVKFKKLRPKRIFYKGMIYPFFVVLFIAGIIGFGSFVAPTINLVKDYNEQIVLEEEGIVWSVKPQPKAGKLIRMEHGTYEYLLREEQINEGEYYKIYYLKYSRYIVEVEESDAEYH